MHFLNGPNKADIYLPKLGTIFPSNFVPTHVDSPHRVVRRDGGTPEIRFHQPFQLLPPSTLLTKFRSSFSPTISILLGESLTLVLINVRDDETIESKCWSKIVFLFKFLCKLCNFYAYEKKGASSRRASIRSIFQIPYLEIIYMFRKYFNYLFSFQNTWNV